MIKAKTFALVLVLVQGFESEETGKKECFCKHPNLEGNLHVPSSCARWEPGNTSDSLKLQMKKHYFPAPTYHQTRAGLGKARQENTRQGHREAGLCMLTTNSYSYRLLNATYVGPAYSREAPLYQNT